MQVNIGDKVLVEAQTLSSAPKTIVEKFSPKYDGPYEVVKVIEQNLRIKLNDATHIVNLDKVRVLNG